MATEDMFIRTVPIDYERLVKEVKVVKDLLDRAEYVHITSPGGTDARNRGASRPARRCGRSLGTATFKGAGGKFDRPVRPLSARNLEILKELLSSTAVYHSTMEIE
ncbi:MAG: hypothetical protein U5P10_09825 [Spirochaetia bacterium]|nr:hypothetical protein [Spirochaetia bacterium]